MSIRISDDFALEDIKTPAYLFNINTLFCRVAFLKSILSKRADICFAMKANPFIIKELRSCVDAFEVCSPGEFNICVDNKIPLENIVVSGVYKEEKDIEYMLKECKNIGVYTAESLEQFNLLEKHSCINKNKIKILLRLTSGNQFGMDKNDIIDIIKNKDEISFVDILGIQFYSGTQKSSITKISKEINMLDAFVKLLNDEYNFVVRELEYGPGFFVSYFMDSKEYNEEAFLNEFLELLNQMQYKGKITLEIGRSIAANCGNYYTRVVDIKSNNKNNYAIIDGGMHQLSYYGQIMAMKKPYFSLLSEKLLPKNELENSDIYTICGSLCTVNDIIVKQTPLDNLKKGDILSFCKTGAYCVTEGISLFLSRDLPTIYLYSEEKGYKIIRDRVDTYKFNKSND